jgi:hypothetical protein
MTTQQVVTDNQILQVIVGSQLTGTNVETSDKDFMSIYVENKENVYGMAPSMDHLSVRTQPEGVRSGPDDTDNLAYSLRKYLSLATGGNPSILMLLFAPRDMIVVDSAIGHELRDTRDAFLSQEAVKKFLGFMHAQHERMLGRGKQNRVPNRPELIEKYGYDTKYASHALRLAIQGYQLAKDGQIYLPMQPRDINLILDIRGGEVTKDRVSSLVSDYEWETQNLLNTNSTVLRPKPDYETISEFSIWAHEFFWDMQGDL